MNVKLLETAYASYFNAKPGFIVPAGWMTLTPRADSRVHGYSDEARATHHHRKRATTPALQMQVSSHFETFPRHCGFG